ncbi:hypothetical protein [Mycolicibacterium confluentis]|nr:hypothetical protein [Mycolicibacterium confluentis]MCV7322304.1 hypothetical protein [Mycolicibacterium confluentis]ORV28376.1 hypothetical protein AWB99_17725 [Mycolicibacterium confluentis]
MRALSMAVVAAVTFGGAIALAPVAAADSWTMPNLIGSDLQGAQDAIQSLTDDQVWFSDSVDLTGQDRMQINDRAWVVCSSTPAPGATFTESTAVTFGVVRKGSESCPGR